jgi:hypothetical protein
MRLIIERNIGMEAFSGLFEWLKFKILDLIWGNGESPFKASKKRRDCSSYYLGNRRA